MRMTKKKEKSSDNLLSQLSQALPDCPLQHIRACVQHALYTHADTTFETVPITLHGKKKYQAYIRDKSEKELGVMLLRRTGLKPLTTGEIKAGDRIIYRWQPGNSELKAQATVRWIRKIGNDLPLNETVSMQERT